LTLLPCDADTPLTLQKRIIQPIARHSPADAGRLGSATIWQASSTPNRRARAEKRLPVRRQASLSYIKNNIVRRNEKNSCV
jgi:hypothetical protein